MKRLITSFFLLLILQVKGQEINPAILEKPWKAQWITGPGFPISIYNASSDRSLKEYGVYKFRKQFDLDEKPAHFIVHVSGDNRYKFYVNGILVSQGPARGDLYFWNFETVDLASYLQKGKNILAALIWHDGLQKPEAQISYLPAFILQGNTEAEEVVNTNESWRTIKDTSYHPLPVRVAGYYVAGPGEYVNMFDHISNWEKPGFDDSNWKPVRSLGPGLTKDAAKDSRGWMLVPSSLPQMEMKAERLASVRRAAGVAVPASFPGSPTSFTIPAHTNASILLDQGYLTNAYPSLIFSKGKNAGISLSYAEALFIRKNENLDAGWIPGMAKGNRNEVEGKILIGKKDSLLSNGAMLQQFQPLWWRTYRYIELRVHTEDEPLIIEDMYGTFTGYPFHMKAKLEGGPGDLNKILEIGWRTARLCAFETYMDCPYYEQLQYIGDARIQALITLYNTGDDRLVKNALSLMDHSRISEGITLSRYPTDLHQQIPTFSLWWIGMLHDYWMYGVDTSFIKEKLPGERQVLSFFSKYQQPDGSLKNVPYWNFTDWVNGWGMGMAPKGKDGSSAVLDLQLLWTYSLAAEMEDRMGIKEVAAGYRKKAAQLKQTIQMKYWSEKRQLYADRSEQDLYSQHTNSLALLSGVIKGEKATRLANKLIADTSITPASIYFKYYLHQALVKAGLGDHYLEWLGKWRENINMGMTTWAEISDINYTRSDCHAWGSSPNIEFFRTVLGIDSDAPGFRSVKIEPHPGNLKKITGEIPHPSGLIRVSYDEGAALISLPGQLSGRFIWEGKQYPLHAGENKIRL